MSQQEFQQTAVNFLIADLFDEIARRLEEHRHNDFRIAIYRSGADTLRELLSPVDLLLRHDGRQGLERVPGLNRTLVRCIEQFVSVGKINVLEQLRGNPVVPWACPRHVISLEAALTSARRPTAPPYGNRVPGTPVNRLPKSARLKRSRRSGNTPKDATQKQPDPPLIEELLSVDAEYRREVAIGSLPKIAPKRFNPDGEVWLPILHTQRFGRHYTALYSNTAHAHEANTVGDWVIVHRDDHAAPGRWTIITSQFGPVAGHRLVLEHEPECEAFYRKHPEGADPDIGRDNSCGETVGPHQLRLFDGR